MLITLWLYVIIFNLFGQFMQLKEVDFDAMEESPIDRM